MESTLIKTIEEQAMFGFTGRINLVDSRSGQMIGNLLMKEGAIVNAVYRGMQGEKAIVSAFVESQVAPAAYKYIVEPEVVPGGHESMNMTVPVLKRALSTLGKDALEAAKLRPPNGLRLVLNDEFVIKGAEVAKDEFSVMKVITDYNKVEDIYMKCHLQEHQITYALVSLRKKGAIKVYKSEVKGG